MKFDYRNMSRGIFTLLLATALFATTGCGPSTPPPAPSKPEIIQKTDTDIRFGLDSNGEPLLCNGGVNRLNFPPGLKNGDRCGVCKFVKKTIQEPSAQDPTQTITKEVTVTQCDYSAASTIDFTCIPDPNLLPKHFSDDPNGPIETEYPGICIRPIQPCTKQWDVCESMSLTTQGFDKDKYTVDNTQGTPYEIALKDFNTTQMICVSPTAGLLMDKKGLCQEQFSALTLQCPNKQHVSIPQVTENFIKSVTPDLFDLFEKPQWEEQCRKKQLGDKQTCKEAAEHIMGKGLYCADQACQLEPFSTRCPIGQECQAIKAKAVFLAGTQTLALPWEVANHCQLLPSGTKKLGERCVTSSDCARGSGSEVACIKGVCMEWCNFKQGSDNRSCTEDRICATNFVNQLGPKQSGASICIGGETDPINTCTFEPGPLQQSNCGSNQFCLPVNPEQKTGICIAQNKLGKKDLEACTANQDCALGYECVDYAFDFSTNKPMKHCMPTCPVDSKNVDSEGWCSSLKKIATKTSSSPHLTQAEADQFTCVSLNQPNNPATATGVCSMTCTKDSLNKKFKNNGVTYVCALTPYGGLSFIPEPTPKPTLKEGEACKDNPYGCPLGTICMIDVNNSAPPTCRQLCSGEDVTCSQTPEKQVCYTATSVKVAILNNPRNTNLINGMQNSAEDKAFKEKINKIWINNRAGLCSPKIKSDL